MTISAITIENFKGIREPVRIELKPITLLFGPNSAGKSTIVQALHYACEIFDRHNLDPDYTVTGGDAINLGGFRNIVHKHDLAKSITIRFDFSVDQHNVFEFPYYAPGIETESEQSEWINDFYWDTIKEQGQPWLEITVSWSSFLRGAVVTSYKTGFGETLFAEINSSSDAKQVALRYLNLESPVFNSEDVGGFGESFLGSHILGQNILQLNIAWQKDALPTQESILFPDLHDLEDDEEIFGTDMFLTKEQFAGLLNSLLIAPIKYLQKDLNQFRYVGPLRKVPGRNFAPALTEDLARWADGLAAWDVLFKGDDAIIDKVNEWLMAKERLNAGYSIVSKRYKELEMDSPLMLALTLSGNDLLDEEIDIKSELLALTVKKRLTIRDEAQNIEVSPMDIGVGISQVLPVVVLALSAWNGILAIEQPELHIHPAFQVALGDLFIEEIRREHKEVLHDGEYHVPDTVEDVPLEDLLASGQNTPTGKIFLLETHSEHLLLRMLRRIRETTDGELGERTSGLDPEQLAVYFIEQEEDAVKVSRIGIDADGDFTDPWPKGFFGERAKELF